MRTFLFLCFWLTPALARAQPPLPVPMPPLSVEQAVTLAVQNNPRLAAAAREVTAAQQGVRAAGARANPEIAFVPALTEGGSDTELLVQQPLEVNGARAARRGGATARLRGAQAQAVVELRGLVFATRSAYYELIRARERAALTRDLLQTVESLDRIARRQVELGARPAIEQTQTGIEVTRARQQATLAESEAAVRAGALNTLLGRNPDHALGAVSAGEPPSVPLPADTNALLRQALENRAEITADEAQAEALRQEARLARAEGLPDLAPQYRAGSVTRGGVEDNGFGVAITLPLLDWGGRRGRVRQAEEAARAQSQRAEATRAQVRQEVQQSLLQARAADAVLAAYPQGLLDQARRLLDASRIGYEEGRTNIVALLEAQRTFRQVQTEFIDAQVAAALSRAELERATGAVPAALLSSISIPAPRRTK